MQALFDFLRRPLGQITVITAACLATYVAIRSMPVEPCEFLHYGDYISDDGVLDACGFEEADFFDLNELRYAIIPELTPIGDLVVGEPILFKLTLFTTTGRPIPADDIVISHTAKVHALVVDESLTDYQHLHPWAEGPDGHYYFEMTPHQAGDYTVYLDFIPMLNNRRTLLQVPFTVPGPGEAPLAQRRYEAEAGGYTFNLAYTEPTFRVGVEDTLTLEVAHPAGKPTRFEPVMDSYAHLVAFAANRAGFAHMHPLNPFIEDQDALDPDLRFKFRVDEPGHYRVWAQVKLEGEELFVPFDLLVEG